MIIIKPQFLNMKNRKICQWDHSDTVIANSVHTQQFTNLFFPYTVLEWNEKDPNIQNFSSLNIFIDFFSFMHPVSNSFLKCHNPKGMNFVKLGWGFD